MLKFTSNTYVPGFRVGLADDPPGFRVGPQTPPAAFTPSDAAYRTNGGLFPTRSGGYVLASGGSPSQDPLRQAVDQANGPPSAGLPYRDPLRQAVDRAANYYGGDAGNPNRVPDDDVGPPVGGLTLGALGAALGAPVPGLGYLLGYGGFQLGNVLQRLHHRGMLDMGNGPSLGVNPVGP